MNSLRALIHLGVVPIAATVFMSAAYANINPTITAPPTPSANELSVISLSATASDADGGDILTITQTGAPASLSFISLPGTSPRTATLAGTLTCHDGDLAPTTYTITWTVNDGASGTASAQTTLKVNNVDIAPVLSPIGNKTVNEGCNLTFTVSATAPCGGVITFSATPLPGTASFNTGTGIFSWTPPSNSAGVYTVTFCARVGLTSSCETITITVVGCTATVSQCPSNGINLTSSNLEYFYLELSGGCTVSDVDLPSIMLSYGGNMISPASQATSGDKCPNNNGVQDLQACFDKTSLNSLFGSLPNGTSNVTVKLVWKLKNGCNMEGSFNLEVKK